MKTYSKLIAVSALIAVSLNAQAATYNDATGENFTTAGGGILDISSVEVNNTATDLIFKINVTGNPVTTDWGKYMIAIDSVPGGDTAGNAWGRPISMPSGMDYWFGTWVDNGNGGNVHSYSGSWSQIAGLGTFGGGPAVVGFSITKNATSITITSPLSLLGLNPGNSFRFDVFTSGGGGGDGAVDALANSSQSIADWGNSYSTSSALSYTIPVPEPTSLALLGIGASLMISRLRRR